MSGEDGKSRGVAFPGGPSEEASAPPPPQPQPYYYGTFQGVVNSQPPQPVIGFPQPMPPPAVHGNPHHYYSHGYQTVPGKSHTFTFIYLFKPQKIVFYLLFVYIHIRGFVI